LFVSTISFLFTTPGIGEPAGGGFPAITLLAEFLLKDLVLLGASFWTLADAIRSGWPIRREPRGPRTPISRTSVITGVVVRVVAAVAVAVVVRIGVVPVSDTGCILLLLPCVAGTQLDFRSTRRARRRHVIAELGDSRRCHVGRGPVRR